MSNETSPIKGLLAGGFGGMCGLVIGHPLDTVKVRIQTMPAPISGQPPQFSGMIDCILKTVRSDGPLGLYKGMGAPFVCVVPAFASCFYGFHVGKLLISRNSNRAELSKLEVLAVGCFAGFFTTVVMTPTERVKCLLQVQAGRSKYAGPRDVIRQLYREGGLSSIFRGASATLLREVPSSGAFFLSNAMIREAMSAMTPDQPLTNLQILAAGGFAGMCNWAVALPMDVLKSRLQAAPEGRYPQGIRSVFKEMAANESLLALYRGAVPVMIRTFPTAGCTFLGYEWGMDFLNSVF